MKETISTNYVEDIQEQFNKRLSPIEPSALVVGSNMNYQKNNIGCAIHTLLENEGWKVFGFNKRQVDITFRPSEQMCRLIETACKEQVPSALIISVGFTELDWFEESTEYAVRETFETNLVAPYLFAQEWVKQAMARIPEVEKKLVFIGSMAYKAVLNGSSAYCASKAGLAHLSQCLAWELAPKGFDVFCVHPSNTQGTPMTEKTIKGLMKYRDLNREEAEKYWGAICPNGEFLTVTEIADTVLFLLNSKNKYLSGSNIELKGGQR